MPANLNQRTEDLQTLGIRSLILPFSFQFNGNSAPVATNAFGYNASVTLSTTGTYVVTFPRGFPEITAVSAENQSTTPSAQQIEIASVTSRNAAGDAQVSVRAMNTGTTTLANVPADPGNRCHLLVFVRQTGKAKI